MATLINSRKALAGVRLNLAALKVFQASYRTYLYSLISVIGMVVMIWAPFGLKRTVGLFEEWSTQRHPSSSLEFIVTYDPTRPFSYAPFVFAQSLVPNSFAGHNLFMILLFVLKGVIVYKLIYRLMPKDRFLALLTGCLFVIYPADTGLMTFRAINIHTSITCGLLSIYMLVAQWQEPKKWRRFIIVVLQFISLGIYEVMYGILLAAPALLLWQEKRLIPSRRLIWAAARWWALPTLMGIRAAYYILGGRARYVNSQLDNGTQSNFTLDTVWGSLSHMIERHFTAWGYTFDKMRADHPSSFLIYAFMSGLLVGVVAWQHWQKGEGTKTNIEWRRSLLLLVSGLILMIISFSPYLPTPYRDKTFRVFYLSSLGAALMVATFIQWGASYLKQYGKIPVAGFTCLLVTLSSYNATRQLAFFVDASDSVQRLLAGILTVAPKVPDNTIIIFVDETVEYQDEWHLAASTGAFISALQYLYFDDYQHARFCTIGAERPFKYCIFRSDGILHFDESGGVTSIPYPQAVVIHTNYHGGFELIEEIPEEYVLRGPAWKDNLDTYDPHGLIDEDGPLPERAYTFFTCWPLDDCLPTLPASIPQTEVLLEFDTNLPGSGWESPMFNRSAAWTTSPISTLNLNIMPGHDYTIQFAVVFALEPAVLDSVALTVNGFDVALERSNFDGGILYSGLIPAEAIATNSANTKLMLSADHLVSPLELGVGEDTRKLGLLVDWLRIEPLQDTVRVEFDTPPTGAGWHVPDASLAWTSNTISTIDMPINTGQEAVTAEFRIAYVLTEEIINSLQFFANDVELPLEREVAADGSYIYRATIPQEVLTVGERGVVHLKFTVAQLGNPQAMGINDDARDLGLLFDWLELRPVSQP